MRILRAAAAVVLAGVLTAGASAQVIPVNNTGCPGFAPPTWSGSAQIGQTISFQLLGRPAPRSFVFLALGYGMGQNLSFYQPFTCVAGPCNWYLAPIGADYIVVTDPFNANLTLPIPNDRRLIFSTFYVQGGFFDGFGSCLTLSQAVGFSISP